MAFPAQWLLLAACVTAVAEITCAQEAATTPSVVLLQIPAHEVFYSPIAESARVSGKVNVRVGVRPDGRVAEVTVFPQADVTWKLLHGTAVDAAARASFECRRCTQPSTAHTIAFVFSFDGFDSAGNPLPAAWKQTGDASSEVTVFGRTPIIGGGPPSRPFHVRAARCLWLWHCSKQAYVTPIM
jgi:hypothetical protein